MIDTSKKFPNLKKQNEVKERINNIRNQIISIIFKLKLLSQKIEDIAINDSYLKIKDVYIDFVRDRMEEMGLYNEELKKELKKMKENIKIIIEVNNLKEDEVLNMNDYQFLEKFSYHL